VSLFICSNSDFFLVHKDENQCRTWYFLCISGGLQTYFSDCLSECRGFVVDLPLLYAQHVMHSYGDTYLSYKASLPILLC